MPEKNYRHRGINEVGEVQSGSDVDWGDTQQSGVTLQLSTSLTELQTGQSRIKEESDITELELQLQFDLRDSALQSMQRALGIPSSEFSGDLTAGTPSKEKLDFTTDQFGTVEKTLYAIGPGPSSTRRIEAARAKLSDPGQFQMAHDSFSGPSVTWDVLDPSSAPALYIEDAV